MSKARSSSSRSRSGKGWNRGDGGLVVRVERTLSNVKGVEVSVEVRIPTIFRKFTGGESTVTAEPGKLGSVLDELAQRYPGFGEQIITPDGELHRYVNIYVNDEDARYLGKLETDVSDGDTVALLPSVAGGAR